MLHKGYLAVKIQIALNIEPIKEIQTKAQCRPGLNLSQVNIHKPMKVDSIKKASKASIANGAPSTI